MSKFRLPAALACMFLIATPSLVSAHNCKCRNRDGRYYELGQSVCLNVDGRSYLARCEMKLNVSSWTPIDDGCPVTQRMSFDQTGTL